MSYICLPMSRTRAERRFNTHVKTTARKALPICPAKISPNGEACTCRRCVSSIKYEETYRNHWDSLQLSSFLKSFDE